MCPKVSHNGFMHFNTVVCLVRFVDVKEMLVECFYPWDSFIASWFTGLCSLTSPSTRGGSSASASTSHCNDSCGCMLKQALKPLWIEHLSASKVINTVNDGQLVQKGFFITLLVSYCCYCCYRWIHPQEWSHPLALLLAASGVMSHIPITRLLFFPTHSCCTIRLVKLSNRCQYLLLGASCLTHFLFRNTLAPKLVQPS